MNPSVISKRRAGLENWLQAVLAIAEFENPVKKFLNIDTNMIEQVVGASQLSEDEQLVHEFTNNLSLQVHSKMNHIVNFEKKFFSRRRTLREQYYNSLISTLIPLCGDDYVGSKALDVLDKLLTSDHNREFQVATKELTKSSIKLLKKMQLNEYLLKKRFCDSQIQAFHILGIIQPHYDTISFSSIVRVI